ncbi:MAG: metal-dependent transcriptional regulator [Actinomycetota bacterium]|nr:metal-dependent transcriptional regulator [Actinomycetota bacterium]
MVESKASPAAQDYLKAIYLEGYEGRPEGADGSVTTSALAARLNVSPASVTNMLKKLEGMGLVDRVSYHGASLTESGLRVALEVIRHHRLLETYLNEALGFPWDKVHAEAEVLEHFISEDLEERISALLGHPTQDPHGHPIPGRQLDEPPCALTRLTDLDEGARAVIAHVSDRDPALLRYLGEHGLVPGAEVTAEAVEPFGGPITLSVAGATHAVGREVAEQVFVEKRGRGS